MNKGILESHNYRKELDGLRAIAVIAVIINHFNRDLLPNGYLGVDMFFVISGYVITLSLVKRKSNNFSDYILGFYERRIKRILPLLLIFLVTTSILICMINAYPIFHLRTAFTSLFGFSNIYLFQISDGYFTASSDLNPFTNTWSLSVEEQFYFIYPFLAWFSGYTRNKKNSSKYLSILLSVLASISIIIFIYNYPLNQNAAYFLMPSRFWEIALGCLAFIGFSKKLKLIDHIKELNGNYLFILLIIFLLNPINTPIINTLSVVSLTVLFILSIKENDFTYKLLTQKKVLKIGLMSYSLYLWHWAIISLSKWTIGIYWWTIPIQIFLIYIVSYLSYKFVESPVRNLKINKKISTYIAGLFSILLGQIIILFLGSNGKRLLFMGNLSNLYIKDLISRTIFINQCNLVRNDFEEVSENKNCSTQNNSDKSIRFILVGDSHANMFFEPFKNLIKENYSLSNFYGNSCSFPVIKDFHLNKSKVCLLQMQKVNFWIYENINPGDQIFIGNHQINKRVFNILKNNLKIEDDLIVNKYVERLEEFTKVILQKGGTVNFLVDGPIFDDITDAYCSAEWFRPKSLIQDKCFIERDEFENQRNYFISYLSKNNENKFNIFHNYLEMICDNKYCSAKGYYDSNHYIEDLGFKILKESYLGSEIMEDKR